MAIDLKKKNSEMLDTLIAYLTDRLSFLPNYKHRRANRQFIGSGFVEKANDLIVSRRQKNKGMHWSLNASDGLAALRSLMLNEGWRFVLAGKSGTSFDNNTPK